MPSANAESTYSRHAMRRNYQDPVERTFEQFESDFGAVSSESVADPYLNSKKLSGGLPVGQAGDGTDSRVTA